MMRYMLEETRLVSFIIENGPRCAAIEGSTVVCVSGESGLKAHVKLLATLLDFGPSKDESVTEAEKQ